jgi:hypothetical protein
MQRIECSEVQERRSARVFCFCVPLVRRLAGVRALFLIAQGGR